MRIDVRTTPGRVHLPQAMIDHLRWVASVWRTTTLPQARQAYAYLKDEAAGHQCTDVLVDVTAVCASFCCLAIERVAQGHRLWLHVYEQAWMYGRTLEEADVNRREATTDRVEDLVTIGGVLLNHVPSRFFQFVDGSQEGTDLVRFDYLNDSARLTLPQLADVAEYCADNAEPLVED